MTKGAENIATFAMTTMSERKFCRLCGGYLMAAYSPLNMWMFSRPPSQTSNSYRGVHVNYAKTVLPMRDGLPKLKDFPKEFGGSGETVPE